jgi:hypothetical protein
MKLLTNIISLSILSTSLYAGTISCTEFPLAKKQSLSSDKSIFQDTYTKNGIFDFRGVSYDESKATSFSGWSNNSSGTQMGVISHGSHYGLFGYNSSIYKNINFTNLNPDYVYDAELSMNFIANDSWDGTSEYGWVTVNGEEIFHKSRSNPYTCSGWSNYNSLQGWDGWNGQGNQRCYQSIKKNIKIYGNKLFVAVGATINQSASDESWSFNNLKINILDRQKASGLKNKYKLTVLYSSDFYFNEYYGYSTNHNDSSSGLLKLNYFSNSPKQLSFTYNTSSESCCDHGYFYVDNILKKRMDGQGSFSIMLFPGNHTLQFSYSKDGSVSHDSDNLKISNINFK